MDLIYADENHNDLGVVSGYSFDLAYGISENDFELQISIADDCCREDYLLYIEGTEYGGVVDDITVNTSSSTVSYHGRTWHGIIDSKIIVPEAGQDYYIVSGEANTVLSELIEKLGIDSFFVVSTEDSGININYQFNRYCKAYSEGILKMLNSVNAKLNVVWLNGMVYLSVSNATDYTTHDDFDSDQVNFKINKAYNTVNHLICLGQGNLAEREVINLYCDENGVISSTQTFYGLDEITEVYENTNAVSEELLSSGIEKFKNLLSTDKVETTLDSDLIYEIGDTVGATEQITDISIVTKINKKIVKIVDSIVSIDYQTGGF